MERVVKGLKNGALSQTKDLDYLTPLVSGL